ncbi:MAG: methyl-accepting chemotaxis protein [Leptolyngbyaceae bacterium]|nr:methyl-accepting chemotaxis protein [Leptolyngbyaceae bacterium]
MTRLPSKPPYQNSASAQNGSKSSQTRSQRSAPSSRAGHSQFSNNSADSSAFSSTLLRNGTTYDEDLVQDVDEPTPSPKGGFLSGLQKLSIKRKATAFAVLIGTVPVMLIGSAAYYFANQSLTAKIRQAEIDRATQLASEINVFMTDRFSDIQLLGQNPILTDPQLYASTPTPEKVAMFDRYVELYGVYNSVAYFNLAGDTILQAQGDPVPNHLTRDYFQRIMSTGRATINPPSISRTTGTLSMHLASPVKRVGTDTIIGVVRFQLPVAGLGKVAENYATESDEFFVIDNSGLYFLASGNEERINQPAAEHFPEFAGLQAAQRTGSAIDVDPDTGRQKLLTYVPLQNLAGQEELDFGVMLTTDTRVAFAEQRQLLFTVLSGTLLAAIAVGFLAGVIANRATKPILDAADTVGKIGQGSLNARMNVKGQDELASLGLNINTMATQLQDLIIEQAMAAEESAILAEIAGSPATTPEGLSDGFIAAFERTRSLFKLDRLTLYRFISDDKGEATTESVASGLPSALDKRIKQFQFPEALLENLQDGQMFVAGNTLEAGLPPEYLKLAKYLQARSTLLIPVMPGNQLVGLLVADHCGEVHQWEEDEVEFFKQLSTQLGLVLDRVNLLKQSEGQAEEQRRLKEELQRRALEMLQEVDPIGRGDLTVAARVTPDEIGTIADSYNLIVSSLKKIVIQVKEAATEVNNTTRENETSVRVLSSEAARQLIEITNALSQVEQMTNAIREVAANAEQAERAVQQAAQTVSEGDEAMNRTVDGIQSIRATVAETAKKVKHLGESSQKISTVVELISTFAAQTNMLALNASIEASRAGEEGRGFAVVAEEVRGLARQSAEATEEIRKLVADIQVETNEVVTAMEEGTEQVVVGTKLVDDTRHSLDKINDVSNLISQLVASIAQATVVQTQAAETVTHTVKDVAQIATKTSDEANRVSTSFEKLRDVADNLQQSIGQFKVS